MEVGWRIKAKLILFCTEEINCVESNCSGEEGRAIGHLLESLLATSSLFAHDVWLAASEGLLPYSGDLSL